MEKYDVSVISSEYAKIILEENDLCPCEMQHRHLARKCLPLAKSTALTMEEFPNPYSAMVLAVFVSRALKELSPEWTRLLHRPGASAAFAHASLAEVSNADVNC